jgi:hypothetical protein
MTAVVRVARRAHEEFRYTLTTRQRSGMIGSASFAVTALGTRTVTTAIRTGRVKVFRDVTVGKVHLHHYLPGIALLTAAGAFGVADSQKLTVHCFPGATYGAGCALVADELPLLINLRDVYWTGRVGGPSAFAWPSSVLRAPTSPPSRSGGASLTRSVRSGRDDRGSSASVASGTRRWSSAAASAAPLPPAGSRRRASTWRSSSAAAAGGLAVSRAT